MKDYIGSADLAIWIVMIAGRLVLCLCLLKKHLFKKLPVFSIYILASTVESILLFVIAFLADYATYYSVFYLTSHVVSTLAFLTLIECARRVLPGLNLPQRERAIAFLLAALAVVVA